MVDATNNLQNPAASAMENDGDATMNGEVANAEDAQPADIFPSLGGSASEAATANSMEMIMDIPVQIVVELGRMKITIKNLLQLTHGSVVELDSIAGEPMGVYVNGTLIAHGEVVVVNDKLGVRLTDIIMPSERARRAGR